jgi:hypothetical protein
MHHTELKQVIETLGAQAKANILVDWPHLEAEKLGPKTAADLVAQNVTLLDALTRLMKSTSDKLILNPTHGAILLTTKEGLKNPRGWMGLLEAPRPGNAGDSKAAATLRHGVGELKADGVVFEDIINFLADPKVTSLELDIDWAALKDAGVDPKQKVDFVLRNALASDALYWIVHSVDAREPLAYAIRNGKIRVSTVAKLRQSQR